MVVYTSALVGGVFIALGILNLDKTVTSLLTGVGIRGLTLGFALQDVASNLMAGFLIELRHPFRVNDVIERANFFGRVSRVTLRDTELAQLDGQIVLIPTRRSSEQACHQPHHRPDTSCGSRDERSRAAPISIGRWMSPGEALTGVNARDPDRDIELFFKSFGQSTVIRFWITARTSSITCARSAAIQRVTHAFDVHHLSSAQPPSPGN